MGWLLDALEWVGRQPMRGWGLPILLGIFALYPGIPLAWSWWKYRKRSED